MVTLFAASQLARGAGERRHPAHVRHAAPEGLRAAQREGARIRAPRRADVVPGRRRRYRRYRTAPAAAQIRDIVDAELTIAVDLPSGLQPDSGDVPGEVWAADHTITFGALKPGVVRVPTSAATCTSVDIGLDRRCRRRRSIWSSAGMPAVLPRPGFDDNKYTRGWSASLQVRRSTGCRAVVHGRCPPRRRGDGAFSGRWDSRTWWPPRAVRTPTSWVRAWLTKDASTRRSPGNGLGAAGGA